MRDSKTGQFLPIPKGQKTDKMRELEKWLDRTLEEDWDQYYIKQDHSQRQLANRWRHPRHLIFHSNHRGDHSQCWMSKLGLPKKPKHSAASAASDQAKFRCEICGNDEVKPHNAHWIANKDGGGT